ncbi:LysR family transcriptional regulator, partial [Kaarinaea lacus]
MKNLPSSTTSGPEKMELEWSDLTVILAICRAGSLSGAARTLGHNHSTIFRKINAIEDKTGVRFFERLPDGYLMTEAGQTALRYAERIESEVHALGREVLGQDMRLQGK